MPCDGTISGCGVTAAHHVPNVRVLGAAPGSLTISFRAWHETPTGTSSIGQSACLPHRMLRVRVARARPYRFVSGTKQHQAVAQISQSAGVPSRRLRGRVPLA